jgi:hypothetical protein
MNINRPAPPGPPLTKWEGHRAATEIGVNPDRH